MPGPALQYVLPVTPRTWRKADNTIGIDPVYSLGTQIPFSCTLNRVPAGSPVILREGTVRANPLSIAANGTIRGARLTASNEVWQTGRMCIGVAINDVELNEMGIAAGPGSIVICTCNDSSVDTLLQTVGTLVVASDSVVGEVKSSDDLTIAGGGFEGSVIGRVVIPATTGVNAGTGSLTAVGVLITL